MVLPNQTKCHITGREAVGNDMVTASNQHSSGVHVALANGHIRFVNPSIQDRDW
jgi:uncharacterized protein YwbE